MIQDKIRFKDLSPWLKTSIIFLWIVVGINILAFMIGFIIGLIEATV